MRVCSQRGYPVYFLSQTLSDPISEAQGWLQAQEETDLENRSVLA